MPCAVFWTPSKVTVTPAIRCETFFDGKVLEAERSRPWPAIVAIRFALEAGDFATSPGASQRADRTSRPCPARPRPPRAGPRRRHRQRPVVVSVAVTSDIRWTSRMTRTRGSQRHLDRQP